MRETEMDVISTSYPAPLTDVPFLQMKWFCGLQSTINKKKNSVLFLILFLSLNSDG